MMAFPRVPTSQIRPPLPSIPPPPPILPMRNGRNRFSQPHHMNPMMAPVAFNRQGLSFSYLFPSPWTPEIMFPRAPVFYGSQQGKRYIKLTNLRLFVAFLWEGVYET